MADPNLTEGAWPRAKDDAAGVYPTTAFQIGGALVTLIVGSIAAVASADGSTSIQIAIPILGGAVALGMTFLAVLAFQFAAAPVRQRNTLREAWPEVTGGSTGSRKAQLWNAYRKGVDLCQRIDNEPARPSHDRRAAEEWTEDTAALLAENVPDEESAAFFSAGEYEDVRRRLEDHVDALKKIIDGLG